jgi:hypothetical protein
MGGFFLEKPHRASLFNEDLLNEPNFGRIQLAGQYLQADIFCFSTLLHLLPLYRRMLGLNSGLLQL